MVPLPQSLLTFCPLECSVAVVALGHGLDEGFPFLLLLVGEKVSD